MCDKKKAKCILVGYKLLLRRQFIYSSLFSSFAIEQQRESEREKKIHTQTKKTIFYVVQINFTGACNFSFEIFTQKSDLTEKNCCSFFFLISIHFLSQKLVNQKAITTKHIFKFKLT